MKLKNKWETVVYKLKRSLLLDWTKGDKSIGTYSISKLIA